MDPWRQSVERRLGELRVDIRDLRADVAAVKGDVSAMKVGLAALKVEGDYLPAKSFIVTALMASLAAFRAITVFAGQIRAPFGVH